MRGPCLAVLLVVVGCGNGTEPEPEPLEYLDPPTAGAESANAPAAAEGVVAIDFACTEGAADVCNAVDDDCDGAIDEGCGFATGALQVSLAWNTDADLELEVSGPSEVTRDHEGAGACGDGADGARLENATAQQASPGIYEIAVRVADGCGGGEAPTTASVSVAAGGRTYGPFNRAIAGNERAPIVTIELR